jgi:hypothetical protein
VFGIWYGKDRVSIVRSMPEATVTPQVHLFTVAFSLWRATITAHNIDTRSPEEQVFGRNDAGFESRDLFRNTSISVFTALRCLALTGCWVGQGHLRNRRKLRRRLMSMLLE